MIALELNSTVAPRPFRCAEVLLRLASPEREDARLAQGVAPAGRLEIERARERRSERQGKRRHVLLRAIGCYTACRAVHQPPGDEGARSRARPHQGIAYGCSRKNAYANATLPMNAIHGIEGTRVRNGMSHNT